MTGASSFDSGTATFAQDVLERSREVPVLVDFWAPWCGPCRALTPTLERVVGEAGGEVVLAKVNVDENQELAARYGVRGIPNVKAFVDGQVVNEFTGALPESGVRRFVAAVAPSPGAKLRQAAQRQVAAGDNAAAEATLREAIALDPNDHGASTDLAGLLVARGDFPGAGAVLAGVPVELRDARAADLAARIDVWNRSRTLPDAATLKARLDATPDDLDARFAYAERLVADGDYGPALAALIAVVRRDRGERRERARKLMVQVFGLAAAEPELVADYRRQLSGALY
jgi:putative thioredoxin